MNHNTPTLSRAHNPAICRAKQAALLAAIASLPEPFTLQQLMAALPADLRETTSCEYIRQNVQRLIHEAVAVQAISKGYSCHPAQYRRLPSFAAHHTHFLSQPLRTPHSTPLDPPTPHELAWRQFRSTELQLPDDHFYSPDSTV